VIIYVSVYTCPPPPPPPHGVTHDVPWHLFFFETMALNLRTFRLKLRGEQFSQYLGATLILYAVEGRFEASVHTWGPENNDAYNWIFIGGTLWRSWLRHCATNRKAAGSIPVGVIGSFYWHKTSGHIMVLGSTQLLTEMSIRSISSAVMATGA